MINKELLELQKGCTATCVVIQNEDCKELDSKIIVNSNCSEIELIKTIQKLTLIKKYQIILLYLKLIKWAKKHNISFTKLLKIENLTDVNCQKI